MHSAVSAQPHSHLNAHLLIVTAVLLPSLCAGHCLKMANLSLFQKPRAGQTSEQQLHSLQTSLVHWGNDCDSSHAFVLCHLKVSPTSQPCLHPHCCATSQAVTCSDLDADEDQPQITLHFAQHCLHCFPICLKYLYIKCL